MIMVGFRGTGEDLKAQDMPWLLESIRAGHVGGVVLFDLDSEQGTRGRNIRSTEQLRALSRTLQLWRPCPCS